MSEERMNPNFNLESCLRNKVNEAKRYLEDKHKRQKDGACEESSYAESFIYYFQDVETILDLYKQEKENRRMAEHNYDELTKTTGRLKTELEEEKKKVRTTIIGRIDQVTLDDLIGDKYISKDRIRKLREIFCNNLVIRCCGRSNRKTFYQAVLNEINKFIDKLLKEE